MREYYSMDQSSGGVHNTTEKEESVKIIHDDIYIVRELRINRYIIKYLKNNHKMKTT